METKITLMFSVASNLHYKIGRCCFKGGTDTVNEMVEDLNIIYSLAKELGHADDSVCEHYHKINMALYGYKGGSTNTLKDWVLDCFTGLMIWLCKKLNYTPCKNIVNYPTTMFFVENSTNTIVGNVY
jgi:hypothetical protein